ncbi:MAG: hypothetical protein M3O67_02850 [Bacteroidota bacterium]|nr:hypothetical protein [Bacteroidota bacterium]
MEVHHHTHTERKRWTHYFWEFFMLFLAITAGFFMENQREKLVEKHRAHEFAESLIADLKKDTAQFISDLKQIDFVAPRIDTFRTLAQTKNINDFPGGTWYYYARFTSWYFSFNSNNATIEQLKSSGSLRYFKNKEVINAIAQYDRICRSIKELYNYEQPIINSTIELRTKIFNAAYFGPIWDFKTPREKIDSFMQKEIKFLDNNTTMLVELANYCQLSVADYSYRKSSYQKTLKLASDLINLLKKEYQLE